MIIVGENIAKKHGIVGKHIIFKEYRSRNIHWSGGETMGDWPNTPLLILDIASSVDTICSPWGEPPRHIWDNVVWVQSPYGDRESYPFSLSWDIKEYDII